MVRDEAANSGVKSAACFSTGTETLLAKGRIAAVEIADPDGTPSDATAKHEPGLRRDGTPAEGKRPEAPPLVVVRNLRGDQIARMQARRQISYAQFEAGRHYHSLHEIAFARALHSLDLATCDRTRTATASNRSATGSVMPSAGCW